jgi:hypothetical protein
MSRRRLFTSNFVGPAGFAAALCHALEGHAGEGAGRLDVEAVRVLLELLLIVSVVAKRNNFTLCRLSPLSQDGKTARFFSLKSLKV